MRELRDRVAVVTGAASGIGLALTESFVNEGMHVVMADIDEQALTVQAQRLGESVRPVVTDVSDQASVERAGQLALDTFGVLHVAVNNAGIVNGGKSWELSLEEWHRVLDTNLWGVIHGVRAFVPLILATGGEGHIVNTSSMAAVLALPGIGPYTVAKHGVLGLSDVLRAELEAGRRSCRRERGHARHDPDWDEPGRIGRTVVSGSQCDRRHPTGAALRVHRRSQHEAGRDTLAGDSGGTGRCAGLDDARERSGRTVTPIGRTQPGPTPALVVGDPLGIGDRAGCLRSPGARGLVRCR